MILVLWRALWEAFYPSGFISLCDLTQLRLVLWRWRSVDLTILFELAQQVHIALVLAAGLGMLQSRFLGRGECVRRLIGDEAG